jgi:hypothetical protein
MLPASMAVWPAEVKELPATGHKRQWCCGCDSSGSDAVACGLAGTGDIARWPAACDNVELGDDGSGRLN